MPTAYRYHRFSSRRQDDGSSIERQDAATTALCIKKGWPVTAPLEDKGRSAWKGDHLRVGQLGKFKLRIESGEIEPGSILVIENLDRLSRQDVKLARRWIEDVTDAGIIVAVCTPEILIDEEALSGTNIVSMIQYLLEAKRSTGESERKSEFQLGIVQGFMAKARQGVVYTARAPMWLKGTKDGQFEIDQDRVAIINQIYEWSAAGLGFGLIAKKLNETIDPWTKPHKASKATWKPGYIRDILTTPSVEGEYHVKAGAAKVPTGEIIRNYYPRIVPADLVERARTAQLARRGATGPNHSEARNLFSGRVICGHCGDTMMRTVHRNKQGREYEYLKCVRFNNGADCVNTSVYRYDKFEPAALKQILHIALDSTHFIKADETGPLRAKLAQLIKDVEILEGERINLMTFLRKHGEDPDTERDLLALRRTLADARQARDNTAEALELARGNVSAEEHLRRVVEVQHAIYSEDPEVQQQARRSVRDAIRSVVQSVVCRRDFPVHQLGQRIRRSPKRQIMLTLAGGLMAYQFDNEGNLLKRHDASSLPDAMLDGLKGTGADAAIQDIKRRRTA